MSTLEVLAPRNYAILAPRYSNDEAEEVGPIFMNIRQLLENRVTQHPEKTFLMFEDVATSYADFDTTVNRMVSGARLAHLKIPGSFDWCGALPKTPTQRVERYKLHEDSAQQHALKA